MMESGPNARQTATPSERKLAAILLADVVGYSRLMGEDEAATHTRFIASREIFTEQIRRHGGRVVGTAGDSILADFGSVVQAVTAAVAAQKALAEFNSDTSPEARLLFRIGINLGDVIVAENDIFGDGVNVAARLEALAEPGGIALSGAVYEQVKSKLNLAFVDKGPQHAKNIAEPIHVYAVDLAAERQKLAPSPRVSRVIIYSLAILMLLLAGGGLFWLRFPYGSIIKDDGTSRNSDASLSSDALGRPTIAVLPFEDRSGENTPSYFSDGITEDVISDLGRFSSILVLSWNAVAPFKGKVIEPREISRILKVRYLVGGTLRRRGQRLRINVQLTNARRGILLWSGRYDKSLDEVFALQDDIAREVVGALAVRVTEIERQRSFEKPTENLAAYDYVLRGRSLLRGADRGANLDAREMFEKAIAIDGDYVDAIVGLGWSYLRDYMFGWSEWPDRAILKARGLAQKSLEMASENAQARALLAAIFTFQQRFEAAEREVEKAIELNPNNAIGHAIHGTMLMWSGRPERAVDPLELALRLDPKPNNWWLVSLGKSYYFLGRYEDCIHLLEKFERLTDEDPAPLALLAASYGQVGRKAKAKEAWAKLRRISPFFDAGIYASHLAKTEHQQHLLQGLTKADVR